MTDKELLKLAAKAVGRPEKPDAPDEDSLEFLLEPYGTWAGEGWNPLINDGDALRLAVTLKLWTHSGMGNFHNETDPYAATRRAIVRAAAEIGKELK